MSESSLSTGNEVEGNRRATRRGFVGGSLAATAAAIAGQVMPRRTHAATKAFKFPELYAGQNATLFKEIQADENAHVAFILSVLGSAARPKPTFQNIVPANVQQFVTMATMFENTGAGAYTGAGVYINSPLNLFESTRLALIEGRHASWLASLLNQPLVPGFSPFQPPLTQDQVVQAASPYIASLNGGPTPGFELARSDANDINILNYALVLEFLESDFYNINVPRFFP